MKKQIVTVSTAILLFSCSKPKPQYSYLANVPKEIKDMKDQITKLESFPLGGYEEELKAMKTNAAVAEIGALDSYLLRIRTQRFDEDGRKMTDEELADVKSQIKYDSISGALMRQIEQNR